MKILYFGTVCDIKAYEQLLVGCQSKPSVATIVFETALLDGFNQNGADLEVYSFPMVPTFPRSKALHFGGKSENLTCGYKCHWLNTINIPILKQWSRRLDARRVIKRWVKDNGSTGVILTYSIPPFLVKDVMKYRKKYSVKTVAIIPDLPQNMYINHKKNILVDTIKQIYLRSSVKAQGEYDGYVYLTEAMRDVVSPQKPYIVMEGIVDLNATYSKDVEKASPKAIMYAGRLHEKYGVMQLVDAFELLKNIDAELWLFGEGDAVTDIKERASVNSRIKYFGSVSRNEILKYEKMATLLVNPRNVKDEFTKYSFPSKTVEYMYSGTPFLTTKLQGIPNEYFDYIFTVDNNEAFSIAKAFEEILMLSEDALKTIGSSANRFISEKKNAKAQSSRIINFLSSLDREL